MRLTCCGTGAGAFTASRASSGYVLQGQEGSLMLDCGPGSVRQALSLGIDLESIDAVVLSHLHEDHCLDLAALAFQAMYRRWDRLPLLIGPPGTEETRSWLMVMRRPNAHVSPTEVCEVGDGDERRVAGFDVLTRETPHAPEIVAYARRFRHDGRTLVFSGDTSPNPALMTELAAGADVLLHECYSRPGLEQYAAMRRPEAGIRILQRVPMTHSEVGEVARIAHEAGVRRLVLTHILPPEEDGNLLETAGRFFKREIIVARDGLALDI